MIYEHKLTLAQIFCILIAFLLLGAGSTLAENTTSSPHANAQMPQYFLALQIYSAQDLNPAKQQVKKLQELGYQSNLGILQSSDEKTRYAIFVSGFNREGEMSATLEKLQDIAGFSKAQRISVTSQTQ